MPIQLEPRDACYKAIRQVVRGDQFASYFALQMALVQLDLRQINELRDAVEQFVSDPEYADRRKADDAFRERFVQ